MASIEHLLLQVTKTLAGGIAATVARRRSQEAAAVEVTAEIAEGTEATGATVVTDRIE